MLQFVKAKIMNLQSRNRAFRIGEHHYDAGNDLFQAMLDKRMTYTCAYWKDAKTLDQAQEAKLDLVCKKLGLKPGQKILDIGCGWGSFMKFAAEKYKVKCVGLTVSKEQVALGRKLCKGLPVEFRLQDYRDTNELFDHIVSLGMFEHVGEKNYREYMNVAYRCLKKDGLFLLHTIGASESGDTSDSADPWLEKYIFPNGYVPTLSEIASAANNLFITEDFHNFGANYDPTLMAWYVNFNKNWNKLNKKYDDRFHRMWNYYLLCCAGSFRARHAQLWQIVFSKHGTVGGYKSIR
jgi:cyclopropane-fatty-acyl-phospholipid synthase